MKSLCLLALCAAMIPEAQACSCDGNSSPVCNVWPSAKHIFRGRVIDSFNGWARTEVLEVYRGLPSDTKQVFIASRIGTSCDHYPRAGREYVIFSPFATGTIGDQFIGEESRMPANWKPFRQTGLSFYPPGMCGPNDPANFTAEDWAVLRSVRDNTIAPSGSIRGHVVQNARTGLSALRISRQRPVQRSRSHG